MLPSPLPNIQTLNTSGFNIFPFSHINVIIPKQTQILEEYGVLSE